MLGPEGDTSVKWATIVAQSCRCANTVCVCVRVCVVTCIFYIHHTDIDRLRHAVALPGPESNINVELAIKVAKSQLNSNSEKGQLCLIFLHRNFQALIFCVHLLNAEWFVKDLLCRQDVRDGQMDGWTKVTIPLWPQGRGVKTACHANQASLKL